MKTLRRRPSSNGVTKLGPNSTVEDRLTRASMLLSYAFDYGVDFQRRTINIVGDIDSDKYLLVDAAMTEMEAESRRAITIKINSDGGDPYQALAIVGRLCQSPCRIKTVGYGHIMSAATLILACGDHRSMSRFGWFMHHEQSTSVSESEKRATTIRLVAEQAAREDLAWARFMADFSDRSVDFWAECGTKVDAYFTPEELLKMGVIDEIF